MRFQKIEYAFLEENPNYIIYNDGKLFSIKSGKFIKPKHYTGGYLQYSLRINGKDKVYKVHRLVAKYFVNNPNPDKYNEVNHKDENKENNCAYNLEWCDRKYNVHYSKTWKKISILNQIQVAKCDIDTHEVIQTYPSIRIAAKENNCTEQNIGQVIRGVQLSAKGYYWKKVN